MNSTDKTRLSIVGLFAVFLVAIIVILGSAAFSIFYHTLMTKPTKIHTHGGFNRTT